MGEGRLLSIGWTAPPLGFVKLNTDGSHCQYRGCIGGGGLLRGHCGSWLGGFTSHASLGSPWLAVLLEIKDLMERSWCIRVTWIHREANYPTDWLARQGASSMDHGLRELVNSSPELDLLLLKDRLAVP